MIITLVERTTCVYLAEGSLHLASTECKTAAHRLLPQGKRAKPRKHH